MYAFPMVKQSGSWILLAAVSISIATGRWGSWIGVPSQNLFFIDLLLIVAFFQAFNVKAQINDALVAFFLALYILFELIVSSQYPLNLRLRDLAPFLYFLLFIGLRSNILRIPRERVSRILRVATLFSLFWNLGKSLGFLDEFTISGLTGVPIFSERSDQFGFVAAIGIITWTEKKFSRLFTSSIRNVIVLAFILEVSLLPGRAGALAALLSLIYLAFAQDVNNQRTRILARRIMYGAIAVTVIGGAIGNFLPEQSSLKRSGILSGTDSAIISGKGTVNARVTAQSQVISWTLANDLALFGAGPGREIVLESGAYKLLSGSVDVRQPHNWWVSIFSRYGGFGLLFWMFLVSYYFGTLTKARFYDSRTYVLISILITATFGVILESPFGLIPFYFFLMRNRDVSTDRSG